ncbi:MAG: FHA domain-containing protein, partial [Pseudomonadota bacterium]
MSHLIRLTSPTFSYDAHIEQDAPPAVLGRDQHASIPLPDPARTISRKHLAVDYAQQGVRIKVLSTVNGVSTANGELTLGQEAILGVGESAQFGMFQLLVVRVSEPGQGSRIDPMESDPFSAIGPREAATQSVFDDAFFTTNKEKSTFAWNAGADPLAAFASERPNTCQDGLRALQTGHPLPGASRHDPMSAFAGNGFGSAAAPRSIDDFLGARTVGNGLGAAKLLRTGNDAPDRRLS